MAASRQLRSGEAIALTDLTTAAGGLAIGLAAEGPQPDVVALLVTGDGRVRTDDDLVFYNNAVSVDGSVSWVGASTGAEWLRIHPDRLGGDVERVVFGCAGGALEGGRAAKFILVITDQGGDEVARAVFESAPADRALVLLEIYRRTNSWRCRLLAQGYSGGLAAFVTEFGVDVAEPDAAADLSDQNGWRANSSPPALDGPADRNPQPAAPSTAIPWSAPANSGRRAGLFTSRKRAQLQAENAELTRVLTATGAMDSVALAAERDRLTGDVAALAAEAERRRGELAALETRLAQVRDAISVAEGDSELTEVGIYSYRHRLDDSIAYKARIESLKDQIKTIAKSGSAVTGNTSWTVNGSSVQGRRMVKEVSKLMLRAYNADADHAVRTMRAYKLESALARLDTTRSTISRLGTSMGVHVTDVYHSLRREELELTADYLNKLEEEKERQRALREQQREQQRADAEYAREQERLTRDRDKYASALARLEAAGKTQDAIEIRSQLTSVNAALDQLSYRRANMRLGHVYVISNIGSFGERMVKIGMTRRIDPMDRVRELGDASVPFRFDVHALIFSEDAVALESALHQRFADQRVNRVNLHREYFYITPAEVRDALAELGSQYLVEYNEQAEAPEWKQSGGRERALLPT